MLDDQTQKDFPLKRTFLCYSEGNARRFSNQLSSFMLAMHKSFLNDGQLTFMLHYRIHDFLRMKL